MRADFIFSSYTTLHFGPFARVSGLDLSLTALLKNCLVGHLNGPTGSLFLHVPTFIEGF